MCESGREGLDESRERAVRAELNRLLESPAFRTSKRCREFLEYIVEHTLCGPSGTLKERSIGVELFQLPQDFDTGQHTIVRVTATEVRKKLAQYYLAENGSYHQVRIELPPGSYTTEFKWETPAVEEQMVEAPAVEADAADTPAVDAPPGETQFTRRLRSSWLTGPLLASVTAILAIAAAFSLWRWYAVKPVSGETKSSPAPASAPGPITSPGSGDLRIIVGSDSQYVDRSGRTWGPDRFFSGGSVRVRPSERILRTLDQDIYRRPRHGDFHYDIPLAPGSYELHLHFAETGLANLISVESSGEGQRIFRVSVNRKQILDMFDVVTDAAGSNIADERVFRNISPAEDGFLHLSFAAIRGTAILSGIEVLPVNPGKVGPVRIRAGWPASWQDSAGRRWRADSYFMGGNALVRTTNPARGTDSMPLDMALYDSERWGHFSYALPVPDGRYRVTLRFCEGHYGRRNSGIGGVGSRVFDVYCNGVALLRDFDILKEAGGEGRPVDRTFSGIRPNAQGKILLSFVPTKGMACVNGIDIVEDSK